MHDTNLFSQMIEKCRLSKDAEKKKRLSRRWSILLQNFRIAQARPSPQTPGQRSTCLASRHLPPSSSPAINFINAKINPGPLVSISNKISAIESLGRVLKDPGGDGLTVNQTKKITSRGVNSSPYIRFCEHPLHLYRSTYLPFRSDGGQRSHIDQHDPSACRIQLKSEWGRCRYHSWLPDGSKGIRS
jgi:hypothetical protein